MSYHSLLLIVHTAKQKKWQLICFAFATPPGLKGQHQRHFTAKNRKCLMYIVAATATTGTTLIVYNFLVLKCQRRDPISSAQASTVPDTPKWHHDLFTNTCTVDNAITIIMIACKENPQLLSFIWSSDIERSLHACMYSANVKR